MLTFRQPFNNEWPITQKYGEKLTSSFHTGIDYCCPFGTSILASADGEIKFAGWDKTGYGNLVIVKHDSMHSTLYAHLSDISVKVGEKVRQGELLGHSGNTGNSTGPHLHFEARMYWNNYSTHFDPMNLPLTSVDDSIANKKLIDASELNIGSVKVVAPSGVRGHNADFSKNIVFPIGTEMFFNGKIIERNGLKFCECVISLWVAANDGDTQILVNS